MRKSSSGRNEDPIPAQASPELRAFILKEQVKKLRKSPDISKMWGFELLDNNHTTYYFTTEEKRNERLKKYKQTAIKKLINPQNKQLK